MTDEPNENDDEFLSYLTRVGARWPGLLELIDQRITEAQKKSPHQNSGVGSNNYLEAQNKLLLEMLLKNTREQASEQQTHAQSKDPSVPNAPTLSAPPGPDGKPPLPPQAKPKAFWK